MKSKCDHGHGERGEILVFRTRYISRVFYCSCKPGHLFAYPVFSECTNRTVRRKRKTCSYRSVLNSSVHSMNVSVLANGIYLYRIKQGGEVIASDKFILGE